MNSTLYHKHDTFDIDNQGSDKRNKLIISTMEGHHLIYQSNIMYLRSDSNYCQLYFVDGTSLLCSRTLKSVYASLCPDHFVRTHRSIVVNRMMVTDVNSDFTLIYLTGDVKVPIARSQKRDMKRLLRIS